MMKVSLLDRFFCQKLCHRTGKYPSYQYRNEVLFSVAEVARAVLDRYAARFGPIYAEQAEKIQDMVCERLGGKHPQTIRALRKDIPHINSIVYPKKQRLKFNYLAMTCGFSYEKAESKCKAEQRKFVSEKYYENARKTPVKRLRRTRIAVWAKDEANLQYCRKIIFNIKKVLNENS